VSGHVRIPLHAVVLLGWLFDARDIHSWRFHNVPYNALYAGQSGYLVTLTATASCRGSQTGNISNTFTWSRARGITASAWPNGRYVQGDIIQTACVTGGTCSPLDIDWSMNAV
jgi:hypothetical protein